MRGKRAAGPIAVVVLIVRKVSEIVLVRRAGVFWVFLRVPDERRSARPAPDHFAGDGHSAVLGAVAPEGRDVLLELPEDQVAAVQADVKAARAYWTVRDIAVTVAMTE